MIDKYNLIQNFLNDFISTEHEATLTLIQIIILFQLKCYSKYYKCKGIQIPTCQTLTIFTS